MKNLLLVGALIALGGCSMMPGNGTKIVEIEEENGVPEWYVEPSEDNEMVVYGAGTGISPDIQFSQDKAMHEAKVQLGDKLSTVVSAQMKSIISDSNITTFSETRKTAQSGYKNVDISKYTIEKKEIFRENRNFRTYILLKLNRADAIVGIANDVNRLDSEEL